MTHKQIDSTEVRKMKKLKFMFLLTGTYLLLRTFKKES